MGAFEEISREVLSWPGVTTAPGRFGAVAFHVGRREIGHLHGDRVADLPFPRRVADELVAAGRAQRHRFAPEQSGWVTVPIEDVPAVVELFRMGYDRTGARD